MNVDDFFTSFNNSLKISFTSQNIGICLYKKSNLEVQCHGYQMSQYTVFKSSSSEKYQRMFFMISESFLTSFDSSLNFLHTNEKIDYL